MQTLEVGQRWTYRTREGEETSTALILALEDWPKGQIVSVRLDGLRLPSPQGGDAVMEQVSHIPIDEQPFRASVLEVVETLPEVPHEDGYDEWKAAYERGEAGVFTLTLAEVVETMEQALRPQQPPNEWGNTQF